MLRRHPLLDPPLADGAAFALLEGRMAMLTRLAEIGMEIAEAAGRRAAALAGGGETGPTDPGLTFSRVARAVRLTIALQSRLAQDLAALGETRGRARAKAAAHRRNRVQAEVERAIEAEYADADADVCNELSRVLWERLNDTDETDILDRPMDELVALICRDLGLSPQAWVPAFVAPLDAHDPPEPEPPEGGPVADLVAGLGTRGASTAPAAHSSA